MNLEPQTPRKSGFKNPFVYSSVLVLIVAGYVAYVMFARYESTKQYEERNAQKAAEQRHQDDIQAVEQLGGSELAIRALYVSPKEIRPGATAQLCYDVANAKTVALDPPAESVWPSHNRCLDVSPKKTTTYTLTIADASGKSVSESVELKVGKKQ